MYSGVLQSDCRHRWQIIGYRGSAPAQIWCTVCGYVTSGRKDVDRHLYDAMFAASGRLAPGDLSAD